MIDAAVPVTTGTSSPPSFGIRLALVALLPYLAAITIFGKGPTYIGVPPVFWGEVVLFLSLGGILIHGGVKAFALPQPWTTSSIILAFQVFGLISTLVHLSEWGWDAARDAAVWYYSLFYYVGLALAQNRESGDRIWSWARWFWIVALIWSCLNFFTGNRLMAMGPTFSRRDISILASSGSDMIQHTGLAACVVIGLVFPSNPRWFRSLLIVAGILGLGIVASSPGRGAKMAVAAGMLAAVFVGWTYRGMIPMSKRLLYLCLLSFLALLPIGMVYEKEIASALRLDRFTLEDQTAEGTVLWRQAWWESLVRETVKRDPVFGMGFGENLGTYSPFLTRDHKNVWPVRSPHNYNITIFARMGFLGLTIWGLILIFGLGRLIRACREDRDPDHRDELLFWLIMLIMTWINASFGVLMEGPVLGVWFWFALGFALGRERQGSTNAHENPHLA